MRRGLSSSAMYLTSSHVLSKVSQEDIFEKYMNLTISFNKAYCNPYRKDKHAGCHFRYSDKGILSFVDYASGKSYTCFHIVKIVKNCTYYQTYQIILDDFDSDVDYTPKKIITDLSVLAEKYKSNFKIEAKKRNYTSLELDTWNIGGIEVTQNNLEEYGIYCAETIWENGRATDNCQFTNIYIGERGVDQIYSPKAKNKRKFINAGNFTHNISHYNYGKSDIFFLTKAKKCAFYASRFGYATGYCANETITLDSEWARRLIEDYKYVCVIGDNDKQGEIYMKNHMDKYGFIPSPVPEKKDLSEYLEYVNYQECSDFLNNC